MPREPLLAGKRLSNTVHVRRAETPADERRASLRYVVEVHAVFRWTAGGELHEGVGSTGNISSKGVYIRSGVCPPVGTRVEIGIDLPTNSGHTRTLRLDSEGVVARVDPSDGGFAVHARRLRMLGK